MLRILLFLAFILRAVGQETMIREVFDPTTDTHVEVLALFTKPSPGGYFPIRVKIANNLKQDRTIRLECTSENRFSYRGELRARSNFELTAPAGKTVTRDFLIPCSPVAKGGSASNSIEITMPGLLANSRQSIYSEFHERQPAILLSAEMFTRYASGLDGEMATKLSAGSSSYRGSAEFSGKFDPKQLPDDWLAFSGYDDVIMTDTDWSDVPPGGRNAILSWVRLGGHLLIYAPAGTTPASLDLPAEAGLGSVALLESSSLNARNLVQRVMAGPILPRKDSINNDYDGGWPLQSHFGSQTFRYGMFVIVLLIFGILVGPVNLFVFAKSGQRHRLFVTTPIISLGASAILIMLIIFQDGFGGRGSRLVLMEVRPDAGINAAFLHQEQISRTGILTSSKFSISPPSVFTPVPITPSRWARFTGAENSGNFDLQSSDGKLAASGDWFQSRSEHGHLLSTVISTRGRIEKTGQEDTFISTFDHPLDTLFYQDSTGNWFRADGIQAGKSFKMTPLDEGLVTSQIKDEKSRFGARNSALLDKVWNRRNHFVAIASQAPGIATNPGIDWKETHTVITGPVMDKP